MIIGLDPGTNLVGYAFVEGNKRSPKIIDYGVLKTQKRAREEMPQRILEIANDLEILLDKYNPTKAIVEDIFFFKNQKTIVSVAQSRGVLLYLLIKRGIEIHSLTPLQLKQYVCGYGRATKSQVQAMVQKVYKMNSKPKPDDAADSLAMAWLGLS